MTANIEPDRIAELEADNRRLRRLLDQRDAPGELRHRLNSTLAMLRVIIRKSAETKRDLHAYASHLEDRVDAMARAQAAADSHGSVELHNILVRRCITARKKASRRPCRDLTFICVRGPARSWLCDR